MRIAQLMPGMCAVFYCENCIRDDVLGAALGRLEHETFVVPLYMPMLGERPPGDAPIFFGGINVFLQQKLALFRRTPRWLDRIFDSPLLLRLVSKMAAMTSSAGLGETTISMLRGEDGRQTKELERLTGWLAANDRPDVIILSNALLIGMVRRLKAELHVPVICLLQDEDGFLDALPEPLRASAWTTLAERAADVDAFAAVSEYYAGEMSGRLKLPAGRVRVIPICLDADEYQPVETPPERPVIGYLSRLCRSHGLMALVDAMIEIRRRGRVEGVTLRAAGGHTAEDDPYLDEVRKRIAANGLADSVELLPNLGGAAKLEFLRSLSVLSVPTLEPQASGVFILEALASGVPAVQPRHGAFVEIIEAAGGGVLVEPSDAGALADAIEELLLDPQRSFELGRRGRRGVVEKFNAGRMASEMAELCENAVLALAR